MSSSHKAGSCKRSWRVNEDFEGRCFVAHSPWHPDIEIEGASIPALRVQVEAFLAEVCTRDGAWDASKFSVSNELLFPSEPDSFLDIGSNQVIPIEKKP